MGGKRGGGKTSVDKGWLCSFALLTMDVHTLYQERPPLGAASLDIIKFNYITINNPGFVPIMD